jgi:preprotein translocase subunit SecG
MEAYNNYSLIPNLRYIAMVLLFLALTAKAGSTSLVANYDFPDHQLKLFDGRIREPLTLSCNWTLSGDYTLSWKRNDTDVKLIKALEKRYQIIDKENKFIITQPDHTDAGIYKCRIDAINEEAVFNVIANVYFKKLSENMAVVEGEKLQIHCKTFGTDPKVTWKIGNNESFDRTRVKLKKDADNVEDAILIIENTVLSDRNMYNCTATNQATGLKHYVPAEQGAYVRVKGKLAALWPFLGICAEVFILCAIILVYEKRRNKADLDESDTDQSPEQEKLKTGK